MDSFNIESLRIKTPDVSVERRKLPRKMKKGPETESKTDRRFLKGPVPLAWLSAASALPGKALAVGVAIWFLHGLQRRPIKVTTKIASTFNVGRKALSRALDSLATAGLIKVTRKAGRAAEIALIATATQGQHNG